MSKNFNEIERLIDALVNNVYECTAKDPNTAKHLIEDQASLYRNPFIYLDSYNNLLSAINEIFNENDKLKEKLKGLGYYD